MLSLFLGSQNYQIYNIELSNWSWGSVVFLLMRGSAFKGPTLYLVFLVIVILVMFTSGSVQSYKINIAESTVTMTL